MFACRRPPHLPCKEKAESISSLLPWGLLARIVFLVPLPERMSAHGPPIINYCFQKAEEILLIFPC